MRGCCRPMRRRPSPPRSPHGCTARHSPLHRGRILLYSRDSDPICRTAGPGAGSVHGPVEQEACPPLPLPCGSVRHPRRRREQTSFAQWNQSGIRDCLPNPAENRRQSKRADTTRRPSHAPRYSRAVERLPSGSVQRRTDRHAGAQSQQNRTSTS